MLTAGAAVAVYVVATLPPAEPCCAGKKLSFWLFRVNDQYLSAAERAETTNAITTIGTNNLDLLIKWFQEPEPPYREPWRRRAMAWLDSKQHLVRFSRPMPAVFHPSRPGMAVWVFHEFPSVARRAIPAFTNIVCDAANIETKAKAVMVLDNVGKDATPFILPLLSSEDATNRSLAAFILGHRAAGEPVLIPKLQHLLSDKSPYPRLAAADALMKLESDPQHLGPIVLQCYREGDATVRYYATDVLGGATNCTSLAVAGLLELFSATTNKEDRLQIYSALNSLHPEAAAAIRTNVFPEHRPKRTEQTPEN